MADAQVLIVSTKVDLATDAVVMALADRGIRCVRLNTEDFPFDSLFSYTISPSGVSFSASNPRISDVAWGAISSVWYRRVRVPTCPPGMNPGVYDFCIREARAALMGSLLGKEARWMSRPEDIWVAEHKPFQLNVARTSGLLVPDTLITNDPAQIRQAFRRFNGQMIVKPTRTGFVDYGDEQQAVYTTQVLDEHLADVESAKLSPSIYQPLLKKDCDVRVTVVGNSIFVAEIDSQSDVDAVVDWRRTSNPQLPHRRGILGTSLIEKILRFTKKLNLEFAAIDLVRTTSGEYVFLEVNPNGQWLWLEDKLNLGITLAIADWLAATSVEKI